MKILIGGSLLSVIVLWILSNTTTWPFLNSLDTLFNGLAFVGLIATIIYQQRELKQNTLALVAQKEEMNNQWQEMEKQNSNIKRQRFEATLFSMWNIHFETRNRLELKGKTGILCFKIFVDLVVHNAKNKRPLQQQSNPNNEINSSVLIKGLVITQAETSFLTVVEPYVSSLKLIFNSIKQADLKDTSEARYLDLTQSYLTNFEVMFLVIYYNHLISTGSESSLTKMYEELNISQSFSYRLKQHYGLNLVVDGTLV